MGEETWAAGKKLKVEQIGADHRTLIPRHHIFSPTCEPGEAPKPAPRWRGVSQERARTLMKAGGCILVQGQGGTGKATFCSEVLAEMEGYRP